MVALKTKHANEDHREGEGYGSFSGMELTLIRSPGVEGHNKSAPRN
jgi:hypothetical protein